MDRAQHTESPFGGAQNIDTQSPFVALLDPLVQEIRTHNALSPSLTMERNSMTDADRKFFSPHDLAKRWNTSEKTLERWRMHGSGPVYFKIGGRVLYGVEQIEEHERGRSRVATGRGLPAGTESGVC